MPSKSIISIDEPINMNRELFLTMVRYFDKNQLFADSIPAAKGIYILIIFVAANKYITVGKRGKMYFKKGYYAYVGSAMNGLRIRIKVHLNTNKKLHWHIDYLLKEAKLIGIICFDAEKKAEDKIACFLNSNLEGIDRFGASDSKVCGTHLFFSKTKKNLIHILDKLKILKNTQKT